MIDYSFLRLKTTLDDALKTGDAPTVTHFFRSAIQLLPNKTYFQISNLDTGIALGLNHRASVIDCNGNELADTTSNTFVSDFTDGNGVSQTQIELVNLQVDFYRQTVLLKFENTDTSNVWYSAPLNITAYEAELTSYFKYKNDETVFGIDYNNANKWQSISIAMHFDIPVDETETQDYFQISKQNTISARALYKVFEQYRIEQIDKFAFDRLNVLFKHDLIYINDIRVTNKPVVGSSERLLDSNWFSTDVLLAKSYKDKSVYDYQFYSGFDYIAFSPNGNFITGTRITDLGIAFTENISLNTGFVTVYAEDLTTIIWSFPETVLTIIDNVLTAPTVGTPIEFLANGTYFATITGGLVTGVLGGDTNTELTGSSGIWKISVTGADFLGTDFNNADFFTN